MTRDRLVVYPRVAVAVFATAAVAYVLVSDGVTDPWGRPIGTDFIAFFTGSQLTLAGIPEGVYDYRHFFAQRDFMGPGYSDFNSWHYPPVFHFFTSFLALLPYGLALFLWLAVPLALYVLLIWKIAPMREAIWLALAFPAVILNIGHGQTGFLVAALLGGALLLTDRRPWLAGMLMGLLTCKPHFGLLLPLYLLITGRREVFLSAAITTVGLLLATVPVLGTEAWIGFFNKLLYVREVLADGHGGYEKMTSLFAVLRHMGVPSVAAVTLHAVVALGATGAAIWIWRRDVSPALHRAGLVTATLLISPYVLDYDLTILAFPIAWLGIEGLRRGFLTWEKTVLVAAWMMPLIARTVTGPTYLPLGPAVLILLMTALVRRAARESRAGGPAGMAQVVSA